MHRHRHRDTQSNATVIEAEGQCSSERNGGRHRDIEREAYSVDRHRHRKT